MVEILVEYFHNFIKRILAQSLNWFKENLITNKTASLILRFIE